MTDHDRPPGSDGGPIAETIARVRELADEPSPVEFESVWLRLNEYVHLAPQLADEVERLRERVARLEDALRLCADALDESMGDTDLEDDTSKAFAAHRAARAALKGST